MAKTIASCFSAGDVILLDGDLGTGKTYFVKGFAEGRGSHDVVTSPTFSLANFYSTPEIELLHMDLYRVESIDEFNDLGLTDFFPQTITIVEWGLKFESVFDEYFLVSLTYSEDKKEMRGITFTFSGTRYNEIMTSILLKLPKLLPC
jgi:tRNA threonylcarbamoyladenosine biosynthesis protein TsaE